MSTIAIRWGHMPKLDPRFPSGLAFASATTRGRKLHLILLDPYNVVALCGIYTGGSLSNASGHLCADCADKAGIVTADDLDIDEEEAAWMAANKS